VQPRILAMHYWRLLLITSPCSLSLLAFGLEHQHIYEVGDVAELGFTVLQNRMPGHSFSITFYDFIFAIGIEETEHAWQPQLAPPGLPAVV
jgi:hypothetical protein